MPADTHTALLRECRDHVFAHDHATGCNKACWPNQACSCGHDDLLVKLDAALSAPSGVVQNAKRYEWLRHGDNDELVIVRNTQTGLDYLPRNEHLDAAIDAAMRQGSDHE